MIILYKVLTNLLNNCIMTHSGTIILWKASVIQLKLHSIKDSPIVFCPIDIFNTFGIDVLDTEQFIYANAVMHVHLSLLFNYFISHGYYLKNL